MNCSEAARNFEAFLSGELSVNESEEFIGHIEHCRDCYDDLNFYYMVKAAAGELSESELENYDLTNLLQNLLEKRKRTLRRRQKLRLIAAGAAALLFVIGAYLLCMFVLF